MSTSAPSTLKRLITSSVLYMVVASIGTIIAIMENRPSEFAGFSTRLPAAQDFLYGNGTALSPPLYMLIALAILTVLAPRRDRWGGVGVVGLTIFGLFTVSGALGEPMLLEILNQVTFDLSKAVIEAELIIVPLAMMVFGILEWSRRRPRVSRMQLSKTKEAVHVNTQPEG